MVKYLLENGASVSESDNNGCEPIYFALMGLDENKEVYLKIIDLLKEYGEEISTTRPINENVIDLIVGINSESIDEGIEGIIYLRENEGIKLDHLNHLDYLSEAPGNRKGWTGGSKFTELLKGIEEIIVSNDFNIKAVEKEYYEIIIAGVIKQNREIWILEELIKNSKFIKSEYFLKERLNSIALAAQMSPICLSKLNSITPESILPRMVNIIELKDGREAKFLSISNFEYTALGATLTYKTEDSSISWTSQKDEVEEQLGIHGIELEHRGQQYIVKIYSDTPVSELVKNVEIGSKKMEYTGETVYNEEKYILFELLPGIRISKWTEKTHDIEDYLGYPVDIEIYDQKHVLWSEMGTEKQVSIKQKTVSILPAKLDLSGHYLKEEDGATGKVIYFSDVFEYDYENWISKEEEISEIIGRRVRVDREDDLLKLSESIEESLPQLLGLKDSNKQVPKLLGKEEKEGRIQYFYSFLGEIDLEEWKTATRKTSFKVLFDEPNKVYHLENGKYKGEKAIILNEYAKIPTKEELSPISTDLLKKGKIFWGYGSGEEKYYSDIESMTHMMQIGASGSGKSNLMNGVILSLLNSIEDIKKIYLIDLKAGEEYSKYEDLDSDKIRFFGDDATPIELLEELLEVEAEMLIRSEVNKKYKGSKKNAPIFVIIDEFGEIENMETYGDRKESEAKEKILSLIDRLARKARSANIKLVIQTQDSTGIEGRVRKNLLTAALLKTSSDMDVPNTIVNEDTGIDHKSFDLGRFILRDENGGNTKFTELQFPYVDEEEELHLDFKDSSQIIHEEHKIEEELIKLVRGKKSSRHLLNTEVLGGEGVKDDPHHGEEVEAKNIVEESTFDFDSFLSDGDEEVVSNEDTNESRDEKEKKYEKEEKEILSMREQNQNTLDELLSGLEE
jgi:hypothetical protein